MNKKTYCYFALAALSLAACTNSDDYFYDEQGKLSDAVSFQVLGKNATRAMLNEEGHYNFGVFGYKSSDQVNPVMADYLVGYQDNNKGYETTGSTVGDPGGVADGQSYWMYEGMGSAQYYGTYAGGALGRFYQSNNPNQYLKYWDKSAEFTRFYAYAPYVGTDDAAKRITYVDGTAQGTSNDTYVMTIPNGTLKAGYDDASKHEFMYAAAKVKNTEYGHDVTLNFKRLVAKVNIKFWEDVPGYRVRILDLKEGLTGVQATPSIKEAGQGNYGYRYGTYYTSNGAKIKFNQADMTGTVKQFNGERVDVGHPANLVFKAPTDAQIGDNRYTAAKSATTYYAIPKGDGADVLADNSTNFANASTTPDADLALTGFTFHVTYELTAEDTGERIVVKNATVHVGKDYCKWKANTHYTYIFKITTSSNGSTEGDPAIDPDDPEVPTTQSLYPIVFDNCTIADWDESETEWNVTDGTEHNYHNITLSPWSLNATTTDTDVDVEIYDGDGHKNADINWNNVTVKAPNGTSLDLKDLDASHTKHYFTVPAGADAGVYTVTYECDGSDLNGSHPRTWKAKLLVGNSYEVKTHKDVIGTKYVDATTAKLNVTVSKDRGAYGTPTVGALSIEHPYGLTEAEKGYVKVNGTDVEVTNQAVPGVYRVVYSVDVEDTPIKVAVYNFTVKDFNFDFNPRIVKKGELTTITCTNFTEGVYTSDLVGAEVTGNQITIEAADVAGVDDNTTQTITYTVHDGDADAKTTYTKTFTVVNSHSVSVQSRELDRNVGTATLDAYSTAPITINTKFCGEETTTDLTGALSIVDDQLHPTTSGDFQIAFDSGNTYKVTCKANVNPGTYYVKYVSKVKGEDVPEYADFVVVE